MRRLTLKELNDEHGGILPPDAILRPDAEPLAGPTEAAGADKPAAPTRGRPRSGRAERFAILNTFADVALAGLTGAEAKVWLILFRDVKAATGTARSGQADIARRAGVSPRGVRKALAGLTAKGLVSVCRRGRLNAGPSVYRVHPTGPP